LSTETLHASCVAYQARAVLILGKSGAGKSQLALELMAYGATLVADDRTVLSAHDGAIYATAAPNIDGLIEARGLGVLCADFVQSARIALAVDLDWPATDRSPKPDDFAVQGCVIPLFPRPYGETVAPAILQYLRAGPSSR